MDMIRYYQINQSNKLAISLQYLKKGMQITFLEVGILLFVGSSQRCPKFPKKDVRNIFEEYWEKIVATALCSILMQNIQIFYGVKPYLLLLVENVIYKI